MRHHVFDRYPFTLSSPNVLLRIARPATLCRIVLEKVPVRFRHLFASMLCQGCVPGMTPGGFTDASGIAPPAIRPDPSSRRGKARQADADSISSTVRNHALQPQHADRPAGSVCAAGQAETSRLRTPRRSRAARRARHRRTCHDQLRRVMRTRTMSRPSRFWPQRQTQPGCGGGTAITSTWQQTLYRRSGRSFPSPEMDGSRIDRVYPAREGTAQAFT